MSDEELSAATDRILAGFDFAQAAAAADRAHRGEVEQLLHGLVEVLDALQALQGQSSASAAGIVVSSRTIDVIAGRVLGVLERAGVAPIACLGKTVDLRHSEVVGVRTGRDQEDTVVEEVIRGYLWRDRLLRQARVIIAGTHGTAGDAGRSGPQGEGR